MCIAAGLLVTAVLGETVAEPGWLARATRGQLVRVGGGWMAGANVAALGFVLLIAGLQEKAVFSTARGWRGLLVKMSGANLVIAALVSVGLTETFAVPLWVEAAALVVVVVSARAGISLLRSGWKHEAVSAEVARANDPRPPVIYLRSFAHDAELLLRSGGWIAGWLGPLRTFLPPFYMVASGPEQELAVLLSQVGPVIAIGKPHERLPELGAARMYVDDTQWRDEVDRMLRECAVALIRAGTTPNVWWELEEAAKVASLRRLVVVSLLPPDETEAFDRRFEGHFGKVKTQSVVDDTPFALRWLAPAAARRTPVGRIIFFADDGTPHAVPITFTMTPIGLVTGIARPYRDSLEAAMRRVFGARGWPWTTRRNQVLAVMLALFGGLLGLHLFYLNDRRRAWRYLAFCWAVVPIFLGFRDGVRLAMLNTAEFDRRYQTT